MSEIVERMAKAMMEADDGERGGHIMVPDTIRLEPYRLRAAAALTALRVPTDAMMAAGCASHPLVSYNQATTLDDIIRAEWTAMVDEALR